MKSSRLLILVLLIPVLALMGCEGEKGAAGIDGVAGVDGADGVDGNNTCLECHNTDAQNAINVQYGLSHHAAGLYVEYTAAQPYFASCARCHNGAGYAEFIDTGENEGLIVNPVPIGCEHCHSIHTTFEADDYALRGATAVPWIADAGEGDTSIDFGDNSNVCANCHQSRRPEPNIDVPGTTFEITSTHYGPHHGAMANVLAGFGFAEIPGDAAYPTTSLHMDQDATCVTCHMWEYADGEGGHTWWPSLAACNDCHATTDTDFDHGGVQTDVQGLLDDLQALLLDQGVIEWVTEDEAYEPVLGVYDMVQAQAFFNWIGLTEDRSLGAHNPAYVKALLMNSIDAITP